MMRVKICGITREEDAVCAWQAGADAIGLIFAESPRRVDAPAARRIAESVPPWILKVGVFVNADPDEIEKTVRAVGLQIVQLHGDEPPEVGARFSPNCFRVVRPRTVEDLRVMVDYPAGAFLLDKWSARARGGTGETMDLDLARAAIATGRPIVLSGGLTPDNVGGAVRAVAPWMVDVASGVECAPGIKDAEKVRLFVRRAYQAWSFIRLQ